VAVTIRNNTRQLLIVTLNSGMTLHLPVGGVSVPVDDLEVNDNAKVAKLRSAGDLTVRRDEAPAPDAEPETSPSRDEGRPNGHDREGENP
jgi:hypothetical protein